MLELLTFDSFVFFLVGVLSMLIHAIKKWAMGEIKGNLIDWYWMNPRATAGSLLLCLGGIASGILGGAFTDYTVGVQILAAWGIGFGSDTMNNQVSK